MWLSSREICAELRISPITLSGLRKRRQIQFIKLGQQYRYALPEASRLAPFPQLERVALLTYQEVAQIVGLSTISVRVAVHDQRLATIREGRRNYVTILELRRFLAAREKRSGQAKRGVSKIIVAWMKEYLEKDEVPVQVLDRLLLEAAKLPEPGRSEAISRLWQLFDEVNAILRSIRNIPYARPTTPT